MRRLFNTARSPYGRKVAIALQLKGLPYEVVTIDLADRPEDYTDLHPLGKVPVLADEDGTIVYDSTVVVEYLEDRYPDPPLLGGSWRERFDARRVEQLGDDLSDQAIVAFFAEPRGMPQQGERARAHIERLLDRIEAELAGPLTGDRLGLGHVSVIVGLGYLEYRHGDGWRHRYPRLAEWFEGWQASPPVAATAPRG